MELSTLVSAAFDNEFKIIVILHMGIILKVYSILNCSQYDVYRDSHNVRNTNFDQDLMLITSNFYYFALYNHISPYKS